MAGIQSNPSAGLRGDSVIAADSSYFVALVDRKDRWHGDAVRIKTGLPRELLVSDLIVAESVTIIGARGGGKPAQTLYEYFLDECDVRYMDEDLLSEAMTLHLRFDGGLSVADCITVVLMTRNGIREIVSFDRDFDKVKGIRRIC